MKTHKKIFKDFSYMFQNDHEKNTPFGMFGIECGNGWNDLIYDLCKEIEKTDALMSCRFTQIKEKWGLLRVYINYGDDKIYDLIYEYEKKSSKICELCGEKAKTRSIHRWLTTLCDKHYKERLNG
jgi:hypothetical protein